MNISMEEVRSVFKQDKNEIIKEYSATGAGVGKEGDTYVIVVYSETRPKNPKKQLYWKEIPLKITYTGKFEIQ